MVSMCDVATRAEVSKATVSRVLNGKGVVSANARQNNGFDKELPDDLTAFGANGPANSYLPGPLGYRS